MEQKDPFEVIGKVPKGKTYQWVTVSVAGSEEIVASQRKAMESGGWRPVPPKRHPKMPRRNSRIEFGGCVLMERAADLTNEAREKDEAAARAMLSQARDRVTIPTTEISPITRQGGAGAYRDAEAPITVLVTIPLRLSTNLVTAASVCGVSPDEYGRRVIILMMRGDLNYMLLPTIECDAFELFDRLIVSRPDKGNANG